MNNEKPLYETCKKMDKIKQAIYEEIATMRSMAILNSGTNSLDLSPKMRSKSEIFLSLAFIPLRDAKMFIRQKEFEMARRNVSIALHYVCCFENYYVEEQLNGDMK